MIPATVTQEIPLRVRLDTAASDSPATLISGVAPLGARVYVYENTSPLLVSGQVQTNLVTQAELDAATDALSTVIVAEVTRATTAEAGKLDEAANLSDVADPAISRDNLGLGTAALADTGTAAGEVPLLGADGRLPIARIASGVPDGTKFVADDGTLQTPAGGGGGGGSTVLPFASLLKLGVD